MPARLLRRPPPSLAERLLGRRRVRLLRRRFGLVALGLGVVLLRPRPRSRPVLPVAAAVAGVCGLAAMVVLLPLR